jgi:hypothetical protein
MSADYFFITSPHYTAEVFIKRLPNEITVFDQENGRFNFTFFERSVWLDSGGDLSGVFPILTNVFNDEQIKSIRQIINPQLFVLTSGNRMILNSVTSLIGNDPSILIYDDTDAPIIWGDEFVSKLRDAVYEDIFDIQKEFDHKYDDAIEEMLKAWNNIIENIPKKSK